MGINVVKYVKRVIKNAVVQIPFLEKHRQIKADRMVDTKKLDASIRLLLNQGPACISPRKRIAGLIVSFTSFPARMVNIKYTIYSLINQTVAPEKMILWLSEKEFHDKHASIPDTIKDFEQYGLEIRFVKENYRSYNKLVFSLSEYPDCSIVTADDDLYYKNDWLEKMVTSHNDYPNDIIAHRVHNISFTDKKIDPYNAWNGTNKDASYLNFLTGCGGVLYPPHALHEDATKSELFTKLAPLADDIWFFVMAILNRRKIRHIENGYQRLISFDLSLYKDAEKIPQLQSDNVHNNQNDVQLNAVLQHYRIYDDFYNRYAIE